MNFIKITLRLLWRNKTYTILNYLCLTFGLSCSIIAMLHINRMLSFDKFHSAYDRLYAVEANVTYFNGDRFPKQVLSASLSDKLAEKTPEFEKITRTVNRSFKFANGEKSFTESGLYADTSFFSMFSFPFISGSFSDKTWGPNSIVITRRMAGKFFGTPDCIGRSLIIGEKGDESVYTVSGVLSDIPDESTIAFDFAIPFARFQSENPDAFEPGASSCQIWVLMNPAANVDFVNSKLKSMISSQESTLGHELFLFPLKDKNLYRYAGGKRVWGNMQYVVLTASLGFSILLIACFNFINLAIAINMRRYREAGVRKAFGAGKSTIIFQYLKETALLVVICLVFATLLLKILLPGFNSLTNGNLRLDMTDAGIISGLALIAFLTVILSGLIPGIYLSSSNPVTTLKGELLKGHSFSLFRSSLIVIQFAVPVIAVICMLVIDAQNRFIQNYDLGFNKDELLIINSSARLNENEENFRQELRAIPGIMNVSFTSCIPAKGTPVTNDVSWEGRDPSVKLHFWRISADYDYDKAVNLKITDGRYFNRDYMADSNCYVINNTAAAVMNYEKPLGRTLTLDGRKGTIIGVFTGFHAIDLAGPFTPTIIEVSKANRNSVLVAFSTVNYSSVVDKAREIYRKYDPDTEFRAVLYSDMIKNSELTSLTRVFAVSLIFSLGLACLGLMGLASFAAASRTKELGIRKINGATTSSLVMLLVSSFSRLLSLSVLIALPIAFLLGNVFLSRFNFRTPMPVWVFVAGPLAVYMAALLQVAWQSYKAASANPVDALRYE